MDRYTLRALISSAGAHDIELWQAYDPVLDRMAAVRIIPRSHPRAAAAAQAAREAATVEHRNLVAVLDVLDPITIEGEECTVIVHEWASGKTLVDLFEDREGEALPVADALHLTRQITVAMIEAHRAGIEHGRIRPGCLLITGPTDPDGGGQVRVRGLGVDRALWGESPDPPVEHPDSHGIGSLLYTAITARWPEGLADGVSGAPRHGGHLLRPTAVVADVPGVIDEICARSIDPRIWGFAPMVRSRGHLTELTPYADLDTLLLALGSDTHATATRLPALPARGRSSGRVMRRIGAGALAAAVVAGLGLAGLTVLSAAPSPWDPDASPIAAPLDNDLLTRTPAPDATTGRPGNATGLRPGQLPVSDVFVFGTNPSAHNPETAEFAVDGNPLTAWTTDRLFSADASSLTAPVGLVLDLGSPRAVSAVTLETTAPGSSVSIRVGTDPQADPATWATLAEAEAITETIELRSPRPVLGRYVLIWFTRLTPGDSGFVSGLREVSVRS